MDEYGIRSIIEMSLAIVGTLGITAIVGNYIFKWHRLRAEMHQKQDISADLSRAIQDEFTRLRRDNSDLHHRITQLEQRLDTAAPNAEIIKQQQLQQR